MSRTELLERAAARAADAHRGRALRARARRTATGSARAGALLPGSHPPRTARARPAIRLRGRPGRLHRLQGLRGRLPQPERPRRDGDRGARSACCTAGPAKPPAQQTVTTSCHHCVDPACLAGCPVQAYEKDPVTGIVRHLDDQCIGCQYCTLMCPYDAPKYSQRQGHRPQVRHVQRSAGRRARRRPACRAVPTRRSASGVVDTIDVAARERGGHLPARRARRPSTPSRPPCTAAQRPAPANLLPADFYSVSPEHSHPPLVIMLVLTQLAVGAFTASLLGQRLLGLPARGAAGAGARRRWRWRWACWRWGPACFTWGARATPGGRSWACAPPG